MPQDPLTGERLPYPGDPDYQGTTRRKRYRPTHPATAEAEFARHNRGRPATSAEKMQRHTYPEFGRSSPDAGAVAAQRAAAGQGQGIVPGPHISEVPGRAQQGGFGQQPAINLEDIIKMLAGDAGGPVTRKPRP